MAYTDIDDPSAYFQVALHSSANAATVTNDGNSDLQPDLIWSKARGATHNHGLYDSTRGVTKFLSTNNTSAETTASSGFDLTSFNTDGFSTGNNQYNTICGGTTYVAWQWKANGGTTATNTDGTLNSVAQANQDAGFSIITWTGAGGVRTVGHGLGVAPDMVICKNRSISSQWLIWHKSLGVGQNLLFLTNAAGGGNLVTATPTSTVFQIGSSAEVSNDCVAYCFAEKQGYSKFGKYVGNGNSNGPFVYTGFKPAFVMIKPNVAGRNWQIIDNSRDPHNAMDRWLQPNLSASEFDGSTASVYMDFLSNGFKLRTDNVSWNQNAQTIIYMAFAENPFVTSTGIPTTAR